MSIDLIITIAYGVATTLSTVIGFVLNKRSKDQAEHFKAVNRFNEVLNDLPDAISEVESKVVGTKQGAIRKTLVMQNAQLECGSRGVQFDLPKVSDQIEKILKAPQKKEEKVEQPKTEEVTEVRTDVQNN